MGKENTSSSESGIRWKLLIIILSVAVIPLVVSAVFIVRIMFSHLERETTVFYRELLEQVATSLDQSYTRTALTLADITLMDSFRKIINAPQFTSRQEERNFTGSVLDENTRMYEEGSLPGGSISRTIMSKLDGSFFIAELDKRSLIYNTDYLIHYFVDGTRNTIIDIDKLRNDPIFTQFKQDNNIRHVLGKPGPDVVFSYKADRRPLMLYPVYSRGQKEFKKMIILLLDSNFLSSHYQGIERLHKGTLYILDSSGLVLEQNHPGDEDYFQYDSDNGEWIMENGDSQDTFYDMNFSEYQRLNVDSTILKNETVNEILSRPQEVDLDGELPPVQINHNGKNYLFMSEKVDGPGLQLLFFYPVATVHAPIYRVVLIILTMIILLIIIVFIVSIVLSKSFATPIVEKTRELKEANDQLTHLDSLKNDFIANITHDFRSPLTVILNSADISLRFKEITTPSIKNSFEVIYNASLKLKNSVNRLLELAKMEAGGLTVKPSIIDLYTFLSNMRDFFSSALATNGLQVTGDFDSLKNVKVYSDREKLEEILSNLLSNAVKFCDIERGLVTISASVNDNTFEVVVSDNGVGIAPSNLERIFNRFEQEEGVERTGGTGIGLAYSRQLAELLDGSLVAESEGKGMGSRFILRLPVDLAIDTDGGSVKESSTGHSFENRHLMVEIEKSAQPGCLEVDFTELNDEDEFYRLKAKILIIDDNNEIRSIIRDYLYGSGYRNFILCSNGKDALNACFDYLPDIIISDYNLPGLRGDELHERLLHNPGFYHVPFLFLSALFDSDVILDLKDKGIVDFLKKPIDPRTLLISVEQQLNLYMSFMKSVYAANHDQLTGLNNRRSIMEILDRMVSVRELRDLSVLFLDVDHFKQFNDQYGHQVGDTLLHMLGTSIRNSIRDSDICGRIGGEEFVVILPETSLKRAQVVAGKIRKSISNTSLTIDNRMLTVTASIGISSMIDHEKFVCTRLEINSLDDIFITGSHSGVDWVRNRQLKKGLPAILLKMADIAMYEAKKTKCGQCGFQSLDTNDFYDNRCSQCGHKNIQHGRDRIVLFDSIFADDFDQ
jgi:diguanylate cyclase (GGDEF)-like protein